MESTAQNEGMMQYRAGLYVALLTVPYDSPDDDFVPSNLASSSSPHPSFPLHFFLLDFDARSQQQQQHQRQRNRTACRQQMLRCDSA